MPLKDVEKESTSMFDTLTTIDWDTVLAEGSIARQKATHERPVVNRPQDILDSWMVVEALSPEAYKTPHKLATDLHGSLIPLRNNKAEPWFNNVPPAKQDKTLYYLVYLGSVRLDRAAKTLITLYGDERAERNNKDGFAALGLVILDEHGIPVADNGLSLSSFGWAYGRALAKQLDDLKHWPLAEEKLLEGLRYCIYRQDDEGKVMPLTLDILQQAYKWMIENCALPEDQLVPPEFVIRLERKPGNIPDTILNSFYLTDLKLVKDALVKGGGGDALKRYLGMTKIKQSFDLLNSPDSNNLVEQCLQPSETPPGRWPGQGRHPLALLQQVAVNLAFNALNDTGVFSVNGPPGTGKTTLLRDVVAGVLVKRAEAMCAFDDPAAAFTSIDNMETKQGYVHFYKPDASLVGYEILIASSNNNAVENVTRELPLKKVIADDVENFRYFKTLSDALSGSADSTWGLIAAVLGNSQNRQAFYKKAWLDNQSSLRTYIDSIIKPVADEEGDVPFIIANEDPPRDLDEAKARWGTAKAQFEAALKRSRAMIKQVQGAYEAQKQIEKRLPSLKQANAHEKEKADRYEQADKCHQQAIHECRDVQESLGVERERERLSNAIKPGWFTRLFRWYAWRLWKANHNNILEALLTMQQCYGDALKAVKAKQAACETARQEHTNAQRETQAIVATIKRYQQEVADAAPYCDQVISQAFWQKTYAEQQKASPHFSKAAQLLRDEVFIAAIKLHKAFVDAASKKLRHNLRLFFGEITGDKIPYEKRQHLALVWQSLFFFTPVISTTFASVGRMLKDLPQESIGWLLIDEAGQARPQEAIGAIYRAKRVMPVGDPLQVEPIEPLPLPLVNSVARYLGVDAARWLAPYASVQTVADHANRFGATIRRDDGDVRIGVPLVVHRRCDEPMFSISNTLAYAGIMVHATKAQPSPIADVLGASQWFDVVGNAQEKWCPEEGDMLLELLVKALAELEQVPDFYVISPFKTVADNAFNLVNTKASLFKAKGIDEPYTWLRKRIGTVHSFQGKEADTVFLLLGAPAKEQYGARNWATSTVNLLNVAASRAKRHFYVIGNKALWGDCGYMRVVKKYIDHT